MDRADRREAPVVEVRVGGAQVSDARQWRSIKEVMHALAPAFAAPPIPARPVVIGADGLSLHDLVVVARSGAPVELHPWAHERMVASRAHVEAHLASGEPVYGITTGLGALADVRIDEEHLEALQHNLVRSHAAGVGDPLPDDVVRAMMLVRAKTLAAGRSGVRPVVAERLVQYLNQGLTPVVPSRGSVGASGDLAQLAHIAVTLLGEGRVRTTDGTVRPTGEVLAERGIVPLRLAAKEGLALVNGTDGMLALGALAAHDAAALLCLADVAAAMTVEAVLGTDRPFAADLQELRPHPGQAASAANLRRLLTDSEIVASHRASAHVVQDPYSLRCTPQVYGAARDTHAHVRRVLATELEAVVDNPVILADGRVESNGNFHGEPLAYVLDFLAIALCGLGNIAERRTSFLLGFGDRRGLPPFLATEPGLRSGYMLVQYTQAALVNECKVLAAPASTDSIPTSGTQEDHVSMGWLAGLKLRQVLDAVAAVLAIEVLCAAEALDRRDLAAAPGTAAARDAVRTVVPRLDGDREVAGDIERALALVADGRLRAAVEAAVGTLE